MKTSVAVERIKDSIKEMELAIGEPAFDEWVLAGKTSEGWKLMGYGGPRLETFVKHFREDMEAMRGTFNPAEFQVGDFGFSHEGHGSGFDAYMCIGKHLFVLFNNVNKSTDEITQNPKWKAAQVPFMGLLELFISDPVEIA